MDVMSAFGSEQIPVDLKITALADVIEELAYLHSKGIIHEPLNVLVCENEDSEFMFKIKDYGCSIINNLSSLQISHSTIMKQLMTLG